MSKKDVAVVVKGYADIIASLADSEVEVSNEALQVVWEGLSNLSDKLCKEWEKCDAQ